VKINILVASKSYLFRVGVAATLGRSDWVSEITAADSDDELARIWMRSRPGVAVLDETTINSSKFMAYVRHIDLAARVVIVTDDDHHVEALSKTLRLGASGYLSRAAGAEDILRCMEEVARGRRFIPAAFERRQREEQLLKALSPRQIEILSLMASGCTNRVIATLLAIGPETVKTHVRYICQKLGVKTRLSAILTAQRLGILEVRR
jgi:two-component system NarL family response regulator